jgi:hypothetical protein
MAAPGNDETDHASNVDNPAAEAAPAPASPPAARPARPARSFLSRLLFSALIMLVLLGIAGYGALVFRDADPRVNLAATYVDEGLKEAQSALDKAQSSVSGLIGEAPKPTNAKVTTHRSGTLAQGPAPLAPPPASEPVDKAPEPTAPEAAKEPEKPVSPAPAAETVPEPPRKPVEIAQEQPPAPIAVEPAKPAAKVEALDAFGFSDRDLISALEGRIDALSDEVKTLREKLDAPKSEARAAPESEVVKSEPAKPESVAPETLRPAIADGAASAFVLAFALQRDLEAGRPYAEEIAALARLGAEPAPPEALVAFSEKGAPTGARLREIFLPLAKKLKALEPGAEAAHEQNLTEHLLHGASKLVKVRPTGQAQPETLEGKIELIESALTHGDFAGAEKLIDNLPEAAKAETAEFAVTLHRRVEAEKAADELLRGAIASISAKK